MSRYVIPKGKHYARGLHLGLYTSDSFEWSVKFDDSARYNIGTGRQGDINKLIGVGFFHGDYSARFGWRYIQNQVEILAYVHDNGWVSKDDDEVILTRIDMNKEAILSLNIEDDYYKFKVNGASDQSVRKTHDYRLCYKRNPYFGGEEVAPHDIRIRVKRLR